MIPNIEKLKNRTGPATGEKVSAADVEALKKLAKLKDQQTLYETLEEDARRDNFIRIFPSPGSDKYHKYFHFRDTLNHELHKNLYGEVEPLTDAVPSDSHYALGF